MKTKLRNSTRLILIAVLHLCFEHVSAQIILNAPESADNPNLAGNSPWTAICAGSSGFNEYFAEISWAGTANADNEFTLELSDASGDFTNAVELAKTTTENTNNPFVLQFAIPIDTRGEGYKMRVLSTSPANTSPASAAYNMYYMDITTNINISELGDGQPPGSVCATNPITLQVDNISNPETYQYIWYKGLDPLSEKSHILNVTESGMYYAFVDYGPICTGSGNTDSNIVDVTIGGGGQGISVNPPTKTALCSGDTETLSINTTDPGWNYQWFKDGSKITGAIATSYSVDASTPGFEGDYQIEISGNSICNEQSAAITITNADNFTISRINDASIVLLPSQSKTLSVSTTANTPSYQWYRNGSTIGTNSSSLNVTQEGTYYVAVTQGGGTCPGTVKNAEATSLVVPDSFEISIDYASAYTACISTNMVLEVKTITAVLSDASTIDVTSDLTSSFSYQWKKNGTDVSGEVSSMTSLTTTTENGDYSIEGTLNTYNAVSNTLPLQLLTNETISISSTSTVYCNTTDTITISTTTDLTGESFEWQRDGTTISTVATALDLNEPGTYRLVLDKNGCSLNSNEITISPLDESLITLDPAGDIIFPEGTSRTVTASGGTAYRWYDANNLEIGNTPSMSFTESGTYTLIANIHNCEIIRQLNVSYLENFKVPNVITVNGDGINDQWVIPNSYSNKADINVIIYNNAGEEILNEFDYKNNWPQSSTAFTKQNMVFFYKIRNDQEVLKQGTITVIR
ncbi:MAG: gliding motility-associated C-terminal domain-containing protein [Flavobacteriaceae bacterium]